MVSRRFVLFGFFAAAGCGRLPFEGTGDNLKPCNETAIDQFFSFTIADSLKPEYFLSDHDPGNDWNSDTETVALVKKALAEILSTPEGYDIISTAVENYGGNKIHIDIDDFDFIGEVHVAAGVPFIKITNNAFRKGSTFFSNGGIRQVSIQRLLVHEIYHLYARHAEELVTASEEERLRYEDQTISFTDAYMQKYYNEKPRSRYSNASFRGGTPEWDFGTRNFTCAPSF
ncbi:MAG: hypothetical protein AAF988_00590 [Pseudomonadota bacterium]